MRCKSQICFLVVTLGFSTAAAFGSQAVLTRTPTRTPTVTPTPVPVVTVAVEDLLGQVNNALALARVQVDEANRAEGEEGERAGRRPRLHSVKLTLQAGVTRETGTKASFFIFQFGTAKVETATKKITLTLSEPEQAKLVPGLKGGPQKLAEELAGAIAGAWLAAQAGQDAVKGLNPTETACEISFGVTRDDKRGLDIVLTPFSLEAGRGASVQTVQTIEIAFALKP